MAGSSKRAEQTYLYAGNTSVRQPLPGLTDKNQNTLFEAEKLPQMPEGTSSLS